MFTPGLAIFFLATIPQSRSRVWRTMVTRAAEEQVSRTFFSAGGSTLVPGAGALSLVSSYIANATAG
jgi:hypothetical protein